MTKHKDLEIPGNTIATAAMVDRIITKTGDVIHKTSFTLERWWEVDTRVKAIRFKNKGEPGVGWLVVITIDTREGPKVAFHEGDTFQSALEGMCKRILNGSLKWKDDQYADEA